jgi:type I restriction enzyme M protein
MNKLENKFWGILDSIRGHKDISEIKELLISCIFLKYVNDTCIMVEDSKIEISQNARWSYLTDNILSPNFPEVLQTAFDTVENENKQLAGTFSTFNLGLKNVNNPGYISTFFKEISDLDFSEEKLRFSEVLEALLNRFGSYEGIRGTDFTTPHSVSQLMIILMNPKNGDVLDSTCGTGGFFQQIEGNFPNGKFQFYGQEINSKTLAIAKLRFAFNQDNTIHFGEPKSTLDNDQFEGLSADYVIMHPPMHLKTWVNSTSDLDPRFSYGLARRSANLAWVQHAIHHLKSEGKAVILLAQSSLFSSQKDEVQIRKKIIENNYLEAIITLPSGILTYTGVNTCIWIINKAKKTEDILMIDSKLLVEKGLKTTHFPVNAIADINQIYKNYSQVKNISQRVNLDEVIAKDYSIHPMDYLNTLDESKLSNPRTLNELVNAVKVKRYNSTEGIRALSIKDLSKDVDNSEINISELEERGELKQHVIFNGRALLLASVGEKIKPCYIDTLGKDIAIQRNVIIYNVNETRVLISFLIQELSKDYVNKQLLSLFKGAAIKHITKKDILSLIVDVPTSIKEQTEIVKREKQVRFEKLVYESGFQKQLEGFKKEQEADLSSKRHMLNQDVSSLNSIVEYIKGEFDSRNNGIQLQTVLDHRDGTTMQLLLNSLTETVRVISNQVNLLSNNIGVLNKEIFDVKVFLKELVKRESNKDFSIIESYDDNEFNTNIYADKEQFRNAFKCVLNNALRHGFINDSVTNVFKITLIDDGDYIDLLLENNGRPLPKGVTKQSYSTKSMKAGKTGNTGIGGWHVGVFAKSHDLEWDLINSKDDEFKVSVILKLNKHEII